VTWSSETTQEVPVSRSFAHGSRALPLPIATSVSRDVCNPGGVR
jgi:hypothetical protein